MRLELDGVVVDLEVLGAVPDGELKQVLAAFGRGDWGDAVRADRFILNDWNVANGVGHVVGEYLLVGGARVTVVLDMERDAGTVAVSRDEQSALDLLALKEEKQVSAHQDHTSRMTTERKDAHFNEQFTP